MNEDDTDAALAHQQELEGRRWSEDMRALETELLKDWFKWWRESDERLAEAIREYRAWRAADGLSGNDHEPAGPTLAGISGATGDGAAAAGAGEASTV